MLRKFTAKVPTCASVWSTGLAFDGTALIRSCWFSNVLQRISPADGSALTPYTISGISDIASLTWDSNRHKLWACSARTKLYQIDLGTKTASLMPFQLSGQCIDGLAWDASDDTLWAGCDACAYLDHYSITGTLLQHFTGVSAKLGNHGRSGIGVQGSSIYLSNSSGEQIYGCTKTLSSCGLLGTFPSTHRIEDLECDDVTFAPRTAVWSQDDATQTLIAFQLPDGACQ